MKKIGFTLAELIITLSIIGVAAALIAPTLSNLMPDRNKVKVLEYYAQIGNAIEDILNDDELYRPRTCLDLAENEYYFTVFEDRCENLNKTQHECKGVTCFVPTEDDPDFATALKNRLSIDEDNLKTDGSRWTLSEWDEDTNTYTLSIDIDSQKDSKEYSGDDTKDINTFVFLIDEYGNITGGDPLTQAYLRNPLNMNDRKVDFEKAAELEG